MTLPKDLQDKWDEANANPGKAIPVGATVVCDSCDKDYTGSLVMGGMIFGSRAICPECEPKWRADIKKYDEERFIKATAAKGQTFREFVIAYRGPDAFIRISGLNK